MEVPLSCLARGLRRFSYVDTIDVTENSDYLIQYWFNGISEMARYMLSSRERGSLSPKVIDSWRRKFERKKSNLLLARRLYLSSPGTHLIAFYSDNPIVGVDLWSLKGLGNDDAKIMTLWLNSSINILQLLHMGVACEGPWMKLHDYMLDRLLTPNPQSLLAEEKEQMLKIFEEVGEHRFKSIREQLRSGDEKRKAVDKAWLKILGYEGNPDELLPNLYKVLLREIEIAGLLEAEGGEEDES